jgi:DNA-binding NarL/FixJ family response regulator
METTDNFSGKVQQKWDSFTWDDVMNEMRANSQKNSFSEDGDAFRMDTEQKQELKKRGRVLLGLGDKYGAVYFTRREAECMVCLLREKTIVSIAAILKISPRTVEYYIKNMKKSLIVEPSLS